MSNSFKVKVEKETFRIICNHRECFKIARSPSIFMVSLFCRISKKKSNSISVNLVYIYSFDNCLIIVALSEYKTKISFKESIRMAFIAFKVHIVVLELCNESYIIRHYRILWNHSWERHVPIGTICSSLFKLSSQHSFLLLLKDL